MQYPEGDDSGVREMSRIAPLKLVHISDVSDYIKRKKDYTSNGFNEGKWRYRPENYTLTHSKYKYEIDIESCTSSEEILDWIFQIAGKTWATPSDIGNLVNALNALLDVQQNLNTLKNCNFNVKKYLDGWRRK